MASRRSKTKPSSKKKKSVPKPRPSKRLPPRKSGKKTAKKKVIRVQGIRPSKAKKVKKKSGFKKPLTPQKTRKNRKHRIVVTTAEERHYVDHIEMREEALQDGRLKFPDQRIHKVETALPGVVKIHGTGPWSRVPRQGVSKNTFIRERLERKNLQEIYYQTRNAINQLAKKHPGWDIFVHFGLTEYGLNLYGTDKLEVASKPFKTEALHKTVMGIPMSNEVETIMFIVEARFEQRLREREDSNTTAIIEYVNVSMYEPNPEKES